jgi:hypothetical protein
MLAVAVVVLLLLVGRPASADDALRGAVVVAGNEVARAAAKQLARAAYRDPALRPTATEAEARVLVGEPLPADAPARLRDLDTLRRAAAASEDPAVSPRLYASLGRELGAALVVVVDAGAADPTARVLRVGEQRFLSVALGPRAGGDPSRPDWSDALAVLRSAAGGSAASGPRASAPSARPARRAASPRAAAAPFPNAGSGSKGAESAPSWLTSPWFWGGIGVVLTAGVTVLVLSQTVYKDPGTVVLEGRIGQ